MKTAQKVKQMGFTLLEILIGMSIMSIMMLLLFASLRLCVQNWNVAERKMARASHATIIQNFLQSKLRSAVPLDSDFLAEPQFSFQGAEDQIQFVAAMPASARRLGLQLFKISLKPAKIRGQGSDLQVEIQPFFPQGNNEKQWDEESIVILTKIKSLKFAYFGADIMHVNSDPIWQDDWLEKYNLPNLVSIEIELHNGEIWPQLIVALKVDSTFGSDRARR